MNYYTTEIYAICPITKQLTTFSGQIIEAPSWKLAEEYCQNNGLGYLHITGILNEIIPCKDNSYDPNWENKIDYSTFKNN